MSHRRDSSTPRTSFSSAHETHVAVLCKQLQHAVAKTVEGLDVSNERQTRCFLSRGELERILTKEALEDLFRELLLGVVTFAVGPTIPRTGLSDVAEKEKESHPSDIDKHIKYYVQKTTGTPSRKALLAVFLYQYREELLSLFLKWLRSDVPDIPSDDSMPFTRAALHRYGIPFLYHHGILGEQAIFKPVTIQRLLHQKFSNEDRLPFIGGQEPIKTGSSGDVVKTEIAQHHWEIDVDGEIIPGNPNNTTIVALKTFKKDANRSMDEATRDFNIELNILKELRSCKTKHDMIMLDWGSITIVDHQGAAISHSLIFELATFSLEDLLKDEDRAKKYLRKGLLLASLVDIVEALACLHDKVQTFHFDIKPDNILIFERDLSRSTSGNQSHHELIWKLSDFGLARKKAARQRVSIASGSAATSVSSTLPATRPPGLYQAPEIQQQNISQAGQGSDVWSIGIVALMVLAFMSNGPTEVSMLETWLKVSFNGAGREPLTYVRSDQRSWRHRSTHKCCYIPEHVPDVDNIPGTTPQLRAALNPKLIEWSNELLLDTYHLRMEQRFVHRILEVIFGSVLRIDRSKRMKASDLRDRLADIQQDWDSYEIAPEKYMPPQIVETSPLASLQDVSHVPQESNSSEEPAFQGQRSQSQEQRLQSQDERVKSQAERVQSQDERVQTQDQRIQMQEQLCSAIERNDSASVRSQLERNPEQLAQPCPGAKRYPIHWALCKNAYDALDVLLEKSTLEITSIVCNRRTALDLACESGKPAALACIRKHRDKFNYPPEIYEKRKKNFGREAGEIADDLFTIKMVATPKERNFLGFLKSKKPSHQ